MSKVIHRHNTPDSKLLQHMDLHPALLRVYLNRGISTSNQLEKDLKHLLPYRDLLGIDSAVSHLFEALKEQQRILIVGDYDVDGAVSTALMVRVLRRFGVQHVDFLLPDRFTHGYGLTPKIVELAIEKYNPDLIVTVDNGISSYQAVENANAAGIKVIITDHHLPPKVLPHAAAIVNPNQPNDQFACKNLAGVGVAFYVLLALRAKLRSENWFIEQNIPETNLADYLDLVATGTITDIVPLDKNNRILVYHGLHRISMGRTCPGISALLDVAKHQSSQVNESDLAFAVGPRLNAAGRLGDMSISVECLLADDLEEARQIALKLEELNQERRALEKNMRTEAFKLLDDYQINNGKNCPYGVCLMNDNWHQGVIGILASRIKSRLHRPTIIFALKNDLELKGSGRSIAGLHLRNVLDTIATNYPNVIKEFGGHAMAAGLTITKDNFVEFSKAFDAEVQRQLKDDMLQDKIMSDGELVGVDLNLEFVECVREAGPWGAGFPEPIFDGRFHVLDKRLVGGHHLKLTLQRDGQSFDAIAFNVDVERCRHLRIEFIHAAYRLDINEYRGRRTLQLIIEHFEPI